MFLNPDSRLGKILTGLFDLALLELLFLVTSIPVITIGPGLCAMFAVCRKLRTEETSLVIRTYFREFLSCFKKGALAWVILGICAALLGFAISYYRQGEGLLSLALQIITWILMGIVWLEFLYVFPLIAWFDNSLTAHLKNAPVLALFHFKTTLLLTALYLFAALVVVPTIPITALLAVSACVFYADILLAKVFARHDPNAAPLPVPSEETEEEE